MALLPKQAAIGTGKANGVDTHFPGLLKSLNNVGRIARGTQTYQHIAFLTQAFQQATIHLVVTIIVSHSSKVRSIAMQGFRWQRISVSIKTTGKFSRQMLGISRAASVATKQHFI